MAVLTDMPPELLEYIFHFLDSVDDVHSFGRACRKTNDVIRRPNLYVEVMRSVIQQASQHRYDIQLCRMLDLHKKISLHLERNGGQLPATQATPAGYSLNVWETALVSACAPSACSNTCCSDCLPNETVYEILSRYQGLRILENMWLERQLMESDFLSVDDSSQLTYSFHSLVGREEEFRDGDIPARNSRTPEIAFYTYLNADQRGRFYSAVVCVWLLNEIRWVFTNFDISARFDVQILLLQKCKEYIAKEKNNHLLDEMDRYAVFAFMYHHLLPLYGTFLADRDTSKLPLTFSSDFTKDNVHCSRLLQLFLAAGQTYLQPPDLVDLVIRSKVSRKPPYPRMTLPTTTERWMQPCSALAMFRSHLSLCDDRHKRAIQRASLPQLSLITRSSFHQTQYHTTQTRIHAPALGQALFTLRDYAKKYFADQAMVAFELYECLGSGRRDIREVFPWMWDRVLWSVWWWANSEEKARAKMERWGEQSQEQLRAGRTPRV